MPDKLIFVYNAKSDIINASFDFAHKILSPKTYLCNLCKLTHGNFREKKEWIDFRQNSNREFEFLHKNEFEETYPREKYPVIFKVRDNKLELVVSKEELNKIDSTEELINKLKTIA